MKRLILLFSLCAVFLCGQDNANIQFQRVDGVSPYYEQVSGLFHKVIEPLYGDQSSALLKIAKAEDRTCEVLLADDTILGIVVYKNFPISEFADNSLEIKTLFVVDAENNSHKGIGSKLVQRVEEVAKMRGIFENIVVTVSEEKPQSIEFFKRKGFEVIKICPDKYKKGMKEYVFCKSLKNKE